MAGYFTRLADWPQSFAIFLHLEKHMNRIRLPALALIVGMVFTVLSGCGGGSPTSAPGGGAGGAYEEKMRKGADAINDYRKKTGGQPGAGAPPVE
jgi:hypothetical protein